MTPSSLVIVTDRGELKAYRVNETPTRGPSLQLVQAFNITDAHGRLVDKLSDVAGRFPVNGRRGRSSRRGFHRRADAVGNRNGPPHSQESSPIKLQKLFRAMERKAGRFAAPAEIHAAIVDLLPAAVRDRIVEHVKSDLVKMEPAKLISRFRSLQQM